MRGKTQNKYLENGGGESSKKNLKEKSPILKPPITARLITNRNRTNRKPQTTLQAIAVWRKVKLQPPIVQFAICADRVCGCAGQIRTSNRTKPIREHP